MREIKFRVWHPDEGNMYYFNCFKEITDWQADDFYRADNTDDACVDFMQFTGLHDKNGKGIYEGDIIFIKGETKLLDIKGKVEYSNILAQFIITNTGSIVNEAEPLGDYEEEDIEVIGNIYDNKELLNETNR